mgnify:CR=1 FL=1
MYFIIQIITMIEDSVLLENYNPSSQELFTAYIMLLLIPFISFIIIHVSISLYYIN